MNLRLSCFVVLALGLSAACGPGDVSIEPIASQTARVNETLIVPLTATGSADYVFAVVGPPDLGAFATTAMVSGTARSGGQFRWTPISSDVGEHEILVQLKDGGSVIAETPMVVTVVASESSAPYFLRPGYGNTYDLKDDPCVRFDIEVRDDDTATVDIRERDELPTGATVTQTGPKSGEFEWCPTANQAGSSERWTIPLVADDGEYQRELNYVIVLRGSSGRDCAGAAPSVTLLSPADGGRITSSSGYQVRASVDDDMGLRDAPLLFYTTSRPDDLANPRVTEFEQIVMRPSSGEWTARVPSFRGEPGESQTYYVLVSATDNDDPNGTACDHRTDSSVVGFEAVIGDGSGELEDCEPCSASTECASGVCASEAAGNFCVQSCSGGGVCGVGTCGATATAEGSVIAGCGPLAEVCSGLGGSDCASDDSREENDTRSSATSYSSPITDGQICRNDPDFFRISVTADQQVTVTLDGFNHADGDLDLQLLDAAGDVLDTSADTSNTEVVEYCFGATTTAFAKVFGYDGAANNYRLGVVRTSGANCCINDRLEPNNDVTGATPLPASNDSEGTVCPGDIDYYSFNVNGPANLTIELLIEDVDADLDIELRSPTGAYITESDGIESFEVLEARVTDSGRYTIGVFGFADDASPYLVAVTTSTASGCASSNECPIEQVCNAGTCVDRSCEFTLSCPLNHTCPTAGPDRSSECGRTCAVNADCRAAEACKWFPEGRFCARRGAGANGAVCADFSACGGQRACMPWTGGYCARAGCTTNADCETNTYCVPRPSLGTNVCAKSCWASATECRTTGYNCDIVDDTSSSVQLVCLPR